MSNYDILSRLTAFVHAFVAFVLQLVSAMTWLDHRRWVEERDEAADRQTASLAAVAVTLLLLAIGLFLVHALHHTATIEDCLLSGRTNCITVADGR